jgi:xanthomonalisin
MPITSHFPGQAARRASLPCLLALALAGPTYATETWVDTHTRGVSLVDEASRLALSPAAVKPLNANALMQITVALQWREPAQLQTFMRDVKRRGSPTFRQYLSPAQFKARHAPTDDQVRAVVGYLRQHGFDHIEVSANHLLVSAQGHAANVETAFHTRMLQLAHNGQLAYANDTPAQVPASLGGIVGSVLGLQELPQAPGASPSFKPASAAAPALPGPEGPYQPTDLLSIYHVGDTPTAAATTVGIITGGNTSQILADLNAYTTQAGLPAVTAQVVAVPDKGGPVYPYTAYAPSGQVDNFTFETDVASQVIAAVSGGVGKMMFYGAGAGNGVAEATVVATYNQAVMDNTAKVIESVFHQDELRAYQSGAQAADDAIFQQAAAQGQTFVVPSGDNGVYEHEYGNYWAVPFVTYSVAEPATSPYVVAVGGTHLINSGGTAWSAEKVWSDFAFNPIATYPLAATGGGVSLFESAPSWQVATLGAQATHRQVPDVAFLAGGQFLRNGGVDTGGMYVVYGKYNDVAQGTAVSSAIFTAIWARIESAHQNNLGLPTQEMYENFASTMPDSPLHDIAGGYNGLTNNANYGGLGYHCDPGWDHCSGWGSLDVAKFNAYVTKYWNTDPGYYLNGDAHAIATTGCYCTSDSIIIRNRSVNAAVLPVTIGAHVTYPKRGDLRVTLVMSDGTQKVLKPADPGDTAANIDATWPVDIPANAVDGSWKLVVDNVARNGSAGTLTSWDMTF